MKIQRAVVALLLSGWTIFTPCSAVAEPMQVEVIPLKYRVPQEVLPVIQPFAGEGGAVTALNNQLIVKASPQNLAQIRLLLQQVDTAPRQLVITVRQGNQDSRDETDARVSGSVAVGGNTTITSSPPPGKPGGLIVGYESDGKRVQGQSAATTSHSDNTNTQHVRVLEGNRALIHVGTSVPLPQTEILITGGKPTVVDSIQYHDVTVGFEVVPRVNADQVTMDISPHRDTLIGKEMNVFHVQRLHTVVTARLGEWVDIGGIVDESSSRDEGQLYSTTRLNRNQRPILLKVDEVQ
jgi:hypothetical protein